MSDLELMVCIPALTRGGVHPRTFQSYLRLKLPPKDRMVFMMPMDRPTTSARSDALRIAKEIGAESLLFIDSDMEFEPDAYERLKKVDGDIVCAMFFRRGLPSFPTITERGKAADGSDILIPINPSGPIRDIDGCGMAFTLIRRPVIEAFDYPAFKHVGAISEDFVFCLEAKDKGFTIRCDPSILIAHRGDVAFAGQPTLSYEGMDDLQYPFGRNMDGAMYEATE